MTHRPLRSLALTLPLLLAACGSTTPGTTNSAGGSNQAPEASILSASGAKLGTAVVVGPSAQFTLNVSDADGTVRTVEWTVAQGSKTLASGNVNGDEVKARLPLTLPALTGGSYTLTVEVTDDRGATASAQTGFTVDATAPVLGTVALNGTALAEGASVNLVVGAASTLTASATDAAAGVTLKVYRGSTLVASGAGSVTADLSGSAAGSASYTLVAVDGVGNSTSRSFTVNYQATSAETPAPAPVLQINNKDAQPYSNTLSVTVSAGVAPGVGVKQVILEVTDARGIVNTTSYVSTQENVTFNVDTTKFPDGELKLRAIAIDAKDQRASSATTSVEVRNAVAPTMTVVTPTDGSSVTGITSIEVSLQQNNTGFSFASSDQTLVLEIIDSRGQLITTQNAVFTRVNEGLYVARTSVDFNATQYLNGTYTLKVRTQVKLNNETAVRTLETTSTVNNRSRIDEPPALNILLPAFLDGTTEKRPVLTRKSAVAVQVSDSDIIKRVQLQFTCDAADIAPGQNCNTSAYNYNIPIDAKGLFYPVFNTGILIDGQPFVENGNYVMRVTATDEAGNSNIKEMKVTVNRAMTGIARVGGGVLSGVGVVSSENAASKFTPASADWGVGSADPLQADQAVNPTRSLTLFYTSASNGADSLFPTIGIGAYNESGTSFLNGANFNVVGGYRTSFLVQDLITGVVELYDGSWVYAAEKK